MARAWRLAAQLFMLATVLGAASWTAAACRPIVHAMGESCVPVAPKRVVVLDTGELDMALALGIQPVGGVTPGAIGKLPRYLAELSGDIEFVGTIAAPSLEQVALLQPDLILGSKLRYSRIYRHLSKIAPTVLSETVGATWKENLDLFSRALGRAEQGQLLLSEYQRRADALNRKFGQQQLPTVSMVRSSAGHVRLYLKNSFIGSIMEDVGLPRPAAQDGPGFALQLRSAEVIEQLDGDVMFISFYGPRQGSLLAEWMDLQLWQQLGAVQRDAVHLVANDVWMLGLGPVAAFKVLDDLERYILNDA